MDAIRESRLGPPASSMARLIPCHARHGCHPRVPFGAPGQLHGALCPPSRSPWLPSASPVWDPRPAPWRARTHAIHYFTFSRWIPGYRHIHFVIIAFHHFKKSIPRCGTVRIRYLSLAQCILHIYLQEPDTLLYCTESCCIGGRMYELNCTPAIPERTNRAITDIT
jgi:hypothetical protein